MASNKSKTPGPIQVVVVLMLTVLAFYFGNRFGQVFDFNTMEITDGALATVNSIVAAPAAISMASVPMLYAIGLAITVLIVWLYTFMYAGNYRYGEEAGSAKWGTLKEGVAFKDQTDPSNNLLFTKNCATWIRRNKKLWSIFLQELLSDMSCRRNYSFCNGTFPIPAFRL